jgi:hypothetical protein
LTLVHSSKATPFNPGATHESNPGGFIGKPENPATPGTAEESHRCFVQREKQMFIAPQAVVTKRHPRQEEPQ